MGFRQDTATLLADKKKNQDVLSGMNRADSDFYSSKPLLLLIEASGSVITSTIDSREEYTYLGLVRCKGPDW